MKAQYKAGKKIIIEVEGENPAELFKQIAVCAEIFEHEECGKCACKEFSFIVRYDDEENDYFELMCKNSSCRARLPFGQNKKPKGYLYPKRRWDSLSDGEKARRSDEESYAENNYGRLPFNGWYKYKKK